jgi:lysine-specific demethylase/histidyl-hydroxylase NO66
VYEGEQKLNRDNCAVFAEDNLGPPVLDEIITPGELLYIPRGYVHSCSSKTGFQYLTLSTYQNHAWCDLLSTAVTETLDAVTRSDIEFRKGLPINWTCLFGKAIVETDRNRAARAVVSSKLKSLLYKIVESVDIDEIADQMGSDFIALRTPPVVRKRNNKSVDENEGRIYGVDPRLHNDLKIRIRNPNWVRIVIDDENVHEPKTLIF